MDHISADAVPEPLSAASPQHRVRTLRPVIEFHVALAEIPVRRDGYLSDPGRATRQSTSAPSLVIGRHQGHACGGLR